METTDVYKAVRCLEDGYVSLFQYANPYNTRYIVGERITSGYHNSMFFAFDTQYRAARYAEEQLTLSFVDKAILLLRANEVRYPETTWLPKYMGGYKEYWSDFNAGRSTQFFESAVVVMPSGRRARSLAKIATPRGTVLVRDFEVVSVVQTILGDYVRG